MKEKKFEEVDQKILEESARLYAEILEEDEDLQELLMEAVADFQDELEWDALFERTQTQLAKATERAEEDIAAGKSEPMDFDRL